MLEDQQLRSIVVHRSLVKLAGLFLKSSSGYIGTTAVLWENDLTSQDDGRSAVRRTILPRNAVGRTAS